MSRMGYQTKCRLCRSEGAKLFLKGLRCTGKCPIDRKGAVLPGMHGAKGRRGKPTDYGIQLRAKQKAKRTYGVLETQFKNLYLQAKKLKGQIGDNLLILLERRLDNVLYVSGLSSSRSHSKQLIGHGHVLLNQKPLNRSSYQVKVGDVVSLNPKIIDTVKDGLRLSDKDFNAPSWLELEKSKYLAKIASLPHLAEIQTGIDINLIIEYYSR
jgi:small subunit ribosomal protein S4